MGYPFQFRVFWNQKVIVEDRDFKKSYVGILTGEDPFYIYLENVVIIIDGKPTETPKLALWKGRIGEVKLSKNG